jgi:HPt (histidine-containing phosphotransfer) domain-containing protein
MTVGTQMQQCIASVQSASASLKTFALETLDQQMKQQFQQLSQTMDQTLLTLQQRQQEIEKQEPQYKQV